MYFKFLIFFLIFITLWILIEHLYYTQTVVREGIRFRRRRRWFRRPRFRPPRIDWGAIRRRLAAAARAAAARLRKIAEQGRAIQKLIRSIKKTSSTVNKIPKEINKMTKNVTTDLRSAGDKFSKIKPTNLINNIKTSMHRSLTNFNMVD